MQDFWIWPSNARLCTNIQSQCTNYVLCYEQEEYDATKNLSEKLVDTVQKDLTLVD